MLIFIVILSILILVHELGHFIAAKRLGIRVEKFSLGFGPKLLGRKFGDTEYLLCAIPFGGYIKMAGDNPDDSRGAGDEFLSRPVGHRVTVISAGPAFNYILAFFCMWMVFYFGFPRMTSQIGDLIPGMPAAKIGLLSGDRILAVDGEKVAYWDEMTKKIHGKKNKSLFLQVQRGDQVFEREMTPQLKEVETILGKKVEVGLIGIKPSDEVSLVRYGLFQALVKGTQALVEMTAMTITALFYIIIGTMSFKESVTGPLGIFFIATNAAKIGFSAVLHVIGILSMSLAVFNLLPLPILDGGHIFFAGLEKIRRRPLSRKTEDAVNNIGLSFLIVLAIFIFCNDLIRHGYWDKALSFFKK
jgi:regulator of sigma E protease